jgi:hypothetical protein
VKNPILGERVIDKRRNKAGTIQRIYVGEYGVPGATWVAVMYDQPDYYGCTTDLMTRELRRERNTRRFIVNT